MGEGGGKGVWGAVGSCLHRNDGRGRRNDGEGCRNGGRGAVGSCLRRNDGGGRGNDGGVDVLRRVRAAARPLVDARGLSPPT